MRIQQPYSRFATAAEVMTDEFQSVIRVMDEITVRHNLPDHSDVNQERYPWAKGLLNVPAFYAARMWEYPFAIHSAELQDGMLCADIGCGMTAFTIYLKEIAKCGVIGVDPDAFESGLRYKGHGVSREFIRKTGLEIIQCGMEAIALPSNRFDRVFCLSVIEHLPPAAARRGVQEMARILKPGGRLIITVDVNMHSDITRPLDLVWESGLLPLGEIDLQWPARRFGIFCDGKQPADVFGLNLIKRDYWVEPQYVSPSGGKDAPLIPHWAIPGLRRPTNGSAHTRPRWRRAAGRLKRATAVLFQK